MTAQDDSEIHKLLKKFAITVKERRLYDPSFELEIEIEKAKQAITALLAGREREREARLAELKSIWNKTQPSIVPSGWQPETQEALLIAERIKELQDQSSAA